MSSGKTTKIIYCIPGLGVDSRVFGDLRLDASVEYLEWIVPRNRESLKSYAGRMAGGIPRESPCILLGFSFGGIIAQILTDILLVDSLILISSIKHTDEKPFVFQFFNIIPLYKLSKGKWRAQTTPLWVPFWGIKNPEDIALIKDMFLKADDTYRMWAIQSLAEWRGEPPDLPLLHIHGDRDKVFPYKRIRGAIRIHGGNHYMIKQRADEVSKIINEWLSAQ